MFRIEKFGSRTIIRDNPIVFWSFYLLFVFAGFAALWLLFHEPQDLVGNIIVGFVGLGNIGFGFYSIQQEPFSVVEVDTEQQQVRITRQRPFRKVQKVYEFSEVDLLFVEVSEHTDGGSVYRPSLQTKPHGIVPISFSWLQRDAEPKRVVKALSEALPEQPVALS